LAILSSVEFIALAVDLIQHPVAEQSASGAPTLFRAFNGLLLGPLAVLVAGLILWRAPRNAVGRYLLLFALGFVGWQFSYQLGSPRSSATAFLAFYTYWGAIGLPSLAYLLVSFPNGRPQTPTIASALTAYAMLKVAGSLLEVLSLAPGVGIGGTLFSNVLSVNPLLVSWLRPAGPWISALFGSQSMLSILGMLGATALLVLRYRTSDPRQRQQIKWLAWVGLVIAFILPLYAYLHFLRPPGSLGPAVQIFDLFAYASLSGLPVLAVGVAILRHQLLDVDLFLNRTLVYGPLTAIVAGLIAASSRLFQTSFIKATGLESDTATIFTTLFVVAAFTPIRGRLQAFVDRYFKEEPNPRLRLEKLGDRIRNELGVLDPVRTVRQVLIESVRAFDAEGGQARLRRGRRWRKIHIEGMGDGRTALRVPIRSGRRPIGELQLGRRRSGLTYSASDRTALESLVDATGEALSPASRSSRR
jgi:hypothetical protein